MKTIDSSATLAESCPVALHCHFNFTVYEHITEPRRFIGAQNGRNGVEGGKKDTRTDKTGFPGLQGFVLMCFDHNNELSPFAPSILMAYRWLDNALQIRAAFAVEVHFENKDSGFFLKHTARWSGAGPPPEPMGTALPGALLSLDRFTVLQGSAPASVRATYGPFSTKQTVPARYAVPDPLEPPRRNATLLELQEATAHRLDVSAHLVFRELPRDAPVLRVLFHTGGEGGARRAAARPRRVCITLHATFGTKTLTATCGPEGEEGACLAELTVPAAWWPSDGKGKRPPRTDASHTIGHVVIRMKVKSGLRLVSVTAANSRWAVTAEVKPRVATVTATRLEQPLRDDDGLDTPEEESSGAAGPGWEEVLTWLVEVGAEGEGDAEASEGESGRGTARLSWSARVSPAPSTTSTTEEPPHEHRVNTRLDIEKDDIQAVLPISKKLRVIYHSSLKVMKRARMAEAV
ncbi:mature oligodendrocyte transmembrane protein [Phthorimaea operculella]|nr:mature oligodendrocyte transmembrane protein [Phthorimaea operculella]